MSAAAERSLEENSIRLNGETFIPDHSGALFWPAESMLIAADLHLEKGSSFARRGSLVPPFDTAAALKKLAGALKAFQARKLLLLGDSFHDTGWPERLDEADRAAITSLGKSAEILWITGNHDPELPQELPGRAAHEISITGITFRHEPQRDFSGFEIAGHLHPALRVPGPRGSVRAKCFASDARRIILPAFGAFAGGLDLRNEAFDGLLDRETSIAHAIGRQKLYRVAAYQ